MPLPSAIPLDVSRKRRLYAVGLVLLLAVVAFLFFRDWLAYRRLGRENAVLQRQVAQAKRRRDVDLPRARQRLAQLEDEQEQFRYLERLPDEDRLDEFFDRISEFEEMTDLEWLQSATKQRAVNRSRAPKAPYERIQYTYTLRGDFFEFCKFINLMENMVRFVTIDEFVVKRSRQREEGQARGKVPCDIKLTFSIYKLKAPTKKKSTLSRRRRGRTARS